MPALTLAATLDPTTIAPAGTSTLTVTRSGGEAVPAATVYSASFTGGVPAGWTTPAGATPITSGIVGGDPFEGVIQNGDGAERTFTNLVAGCTFSLGGGEGSLTAIEVYANNVSLGIQPLPYYGNRTWTIPASGTVIIKFISRSNQETNLQGVSLTSPAINTATDPLTVTLSSDDIDVATVPASVIILENETSATATVTGVADGTATIDATYNSVSDDAEITVATPDTTRPTVVSAVIVNNDNNSSELQVEWSEPPVHLTEPTISISGATVGAINVVGNTLLYSITPVVYDDVTDITISYAADAVEDAAGNQNLIVTDYPVTNNSGVERPPDSTNNATVSAPNGSTTIATLQLSVQQQITIAGGTELSVVQGNDYTRYGVRIDLDTSGLEDPDEDLSAYKFVIAVQASPVFGVRMSIAGDPGEHYAIFSPASTLTETWPVGRYNCLYRLEVAANKYEAIGLPGVIEITPFDIDDDDIIDIDVE